MIGVVKLRKIRSGWKWQFLTRFGELLANGVKIQDTPTAALEDAASMLSAVLGGPLNLPPTPRVGGTAELTNNLTVWRHS